MLKLPFDPVWISESIRDIPVIGELFMIAIDSIRSFIVVVQSSGSFTLIVWVSYPNWSLTSDESFALPIGVVSVSLSNLFCIRSLSSLLSIYLTRGTRLIPVDPINRLFTFLKRINSLFNPFFNPFFTFLKIGWKNSEKIPSFGFGSPKGMLVSNPRVVK